jgi:hypothetical protein
LNEHELALIGLLDYASLVRQHGGAIVRSAAVAFELADQAGAESIHRIDKTGAPPVAPSSGPLVMPVLPPLPHQPPIASIPALPPPAIGGDKFSAELHSGPGSGDLRDFSSDWHNYSRDITSCADDPRAVAVSINEHWSDGDNGCGWGRGRVCG